MALGKCQEIKVRGECGFITNQIRAAQVIAELPVRNGSFGVCQEECPDCPAKPNRKVQFTDVDNFSFNQLQDQRILVFTPIPQTT